MLEKYQLLQSICLWSTVILGILTAVAGGGLKYYGQKVNTIRETLSKEVHEEAKNEIIAKIEDIDTLASTHISGDFVFGDKKEEVIGNKEIKETKINAPNALIVTEGQSGGSNTVINKKVDIPLPTVKLHEWYIQNRKVNEIPVKHSIDTLKLPSKDFPYDSLYYNQLRVDFYSEAMLNGIGFRLKRQDVVFGKIGSDGRVLVKSGMSLEGYVFILAQPQNGLYYIDFFTIREIEDPLTEFDYLK